MIYNILKKEGYTIKTVSLCEAKDTARCPRKYFCDCEENRIFVTVGTTDTQKFYLKRAVQGAIKAKSILGVYCTVPTPIASGEYNNYYYVIYILLLYKV